MPSRKVMIHSSKKRCTACIAICKRPSSRFAKRWRQTSLLVLSWRFPDFIEQKQWSWWLIISHSWLPRKYWRIVAILQNTMSFDQRFCTNNAIFGSMRIRPKNKLFRSKIFFFKAFRHFQTGVLAAVWRSAKISIWGRKHFVTIFQPRPIWEGGVEDKEELSGW